MNVLELALFSTWRPKSYYRGEEPKRRYFSRDLFVANEVKLLLNALVYNLMHAVRTLMEKVSGEGWSLQRVREWLLKLLARLLLHSCCVILVLCAAAALLWAMLWRALAGWRWMPPPISA